MLTRIWSKFKKLQNSLLFKGSPPIYTTKRINGLKIHVGSGPINLQGWVNIDARPASHIHLTSEGFSLKEFADGEIEEIYMCHVLEHFSFQEVRSILKNFRKKLQPGGVLRLSVPDFDKLIKIYKANNNRLEVVKYALMGGQDYEYNYHKCVFNKHSLSQMLAENKFGNVQEWNTLDDFGVSLTDWSDHDFKTPGGSFPVSLNIKAIKK